MWDDVSVSCLDVSVIDLKDIEENFRIDVVPPKSNHSSLLSPSTKSSFVNLLDLNRSQNICESH